MKTETVTLKCRRRWWRWGRVYVEAEALADALSAVSEHIRDGSNRFPPEEIVANLSRTIRSLDTEVDVRLVTFR